MFKNLKSAKQWLQDNAVAAASAWYEDGPTRGGVVDYAGPGEIWPATGQPFLGSGYHGPNDDLAARLEVK